MAPGPDGTAFNITAQARRENRLATHTPVVKCPKREVDTH